MPAAARGPAGIWIQAAGLATEPSHIDSLPARPRGRIDRDWAYWTGREKGPRSNADLEECSNYCRRSPERLVGVQLRDGLWGMDRRAHARPVDRCSSRLHSSGVVCPAHRFGVEARWVKVPAVRSASPTAAQRRPWNGVSGLWRGAYCPHSRCNAARGASPGAAAAGRAGAAADRTTGIVAVAVGEATMISSAGGGSTPAAA